MAYNIFEKASPGNNKFVVVTKQEKFNYIKTTPITKISPIKFLSRKFAKSLTQYEFVVVHWMDELKMQLIMNAPKEVKFVWIGWGGDYYGYIEKNLYLPLTQNLIVNMSASTGKPSFKSRIKNLVKQNLFLGGIRDKEKVLNRIDYFAPVLEEDYHLVANSFKVFMPRFIDWNYGTLEDDIIPDMSITISGNNILVGNSATAENNHLDTFELLKYIDLTDRKIICPLSYGDPEYGKIVEMKAKEQFGDKVDTLATFLPINEYNKIISSCSVVVMNHLRQQAVGNIVSMLFLGAKVFLNKKNPVYDFFKNNGAVIFSIDELTDDSIGTILSEDEKHINKEVLKKYWTRDVILEKTRSLIYTLRKEINA
jgi:hypothetical protein